MNAYLPLLNSIGLIFLAGAIIYTQIRSGSKAVSNEVMANYKALDDQQKEIINKQNEDVAVMKTRISTLETQMAEARGREAAKDKQILDLQAITRNMNPELLSILNEIRDFMAQLNGKMKDSKGVLDYQTGMIEGQVSRESKQDVATDSGVGNIVKNPLPNNK